MRSGCFDLPDPVPDDIAPAADSAPVDHHVEELLLALTELQRRRRAHGNLLPPDLSD